MKYLLSILSLISLISCVSVQLQPKKISTSKNYEFANPSAGFSKKESKDVDHLWIHDSNGNSISVRSACNDPADPDLQSVRVASLDGLKIEKEVFQKNTEYNKREALHSLQEVKLDGILVNIELLNFTKNNCYYVLSYISVNKNYSVNKKDFDQFLNNFKVP